MKWGSINAIAYCVEPSKKGPGNGTYTIQNLADGKTLAKVCYYGTKASDENGFFDEKHPDFPAGKRFIITHLAAVHIIWFHITPMVSDLLIGLCAIMMVISVALYIIQNTRTLKGETV